MSALLPLISGLPLVGSALLIFIPDRKEKLIHRLAELTVALFSLFIVIAAVQHLFLKEVIESRFHLFSWGEYEFEFAQSLDLFGSVFLIMTAFLGGMVVRFSRYYLHREAGQGRFFGTILMFLGGMSVVELAADLDTLFMGWEVVGIASFLLIAFYRDRDQPVRNALKIYSVYRFCDVGLLLGAYLEHSQMGTTDFAAFAAHPLTQAQALPLCLLLLLAASGKSAQIPFSFWVPRAMEGPTPSSAVFYGALSIHAGVFLLLRTIGFWSTCEPAVWVIGIVGALTAITATFSGRTQSNIKAQIGYASVTQVGLMFVEMAMGYPYVALFHFVGNASLRCFQLLVSPSVVAYLLRLQSTTAINGRVTISDRFWEKNRGKLFDRLRATMFVLGVSEGYWESLLRTMLWRPLRQVAKWIHTKPWYFFVLALSGFYFSNLVGGLGVAGFCVVQALADDRKTERVWAYSLIASLALAISLALDVNVGWHSIIPFLAGILPSYFVGVMGLSLGQRGRFLVFLSFLGMSGFPISPAFFGEDLLLSSAIHIHWGVALIFTLVFIINGLALIRAFARHYFGSQQEGGRYEVA